MTEKSAVRICAPLYGTRFRSVYRPDCAFDRHQHDQPLDLAPPAKVEVIAAFRTGVGTAGGFKAGVFAIVPDKVGGFGNFGSIC